jgi:hypothetical protein
MNEVVGQVSQIQGLFVQFDCSGTFGLVLVLTHSTITIILQKIFRSDLISDAE